MRHRSGIFLAEQCVGKSRHVKMRVYAGRWLSMQFKPDECLPGRCVLRA
jgi:hypothetical protein